MVSKLRNQGHEIAVHSITHRTPGNLSFVDELYNYSCNNYTCFVWKVISRIFCTQVSVLLDFRAVDLHFFCEKWFHEFFCTLFQNPGGKVMLLLKTGLTKWLVKQISLIVLVESKWRIFVESVFHVSFFKEKYPFHVNICFINYYFFGFHIKFQTWNQDGIVNFWWWKNLDLCMIAPFQLPCLILHYGLILLITKFHINVLEDANAHLDLSLEFG